MLGKSTIDTIAQALDVAERTRTRIRPPSVQYEGFTTEDAYAVQRRWVELKVARGNPIKGRKIGLTSRAMQRQANITEPDYGALMEDMFYGTGAELPMNRFIQPRLECELGFVIGKRLEGPHCTIFDVLSATDYIVPAAEIVDGRTHRVDPDTDKPRSVLDSIADNAGNAALIIGGRPIRPMDVDLRWVGVLCHRNNVIEESGVAAAVLNHPANGVAWLANKLAPFGTALEPGEFVLGGSFTSVVEARAGDTFHIDYGPLGSISARFAG
jgi:2-oxo-hept-3-ene-1,7-dioate hydratase